MRRYRLPQIGDLYFTHAAVRGPSGVSVLRLLVDTGSTYTILPVEVLEALGCDPTASKARERIATASGYLLAPRVAVSWVQALGKKRRNMQVVAHTLPPAGPIDGLLGMDFLIAIKAKIDLSTGVVEVH
jgi:aspartyl protease family protein